MMADFRDYRSRFFPATKLAERLQVVQRHRRIPHLGFPIQPDGSRNMLAIAESDPIATSDFGGQYEGSLLAGAW
jgi:hypothetical protein